MVELIKSTLAQMAGSSPPQLLAVLQERGVLLTFMDICSEGLDLSCVAAVLQSFLSPDATRKLLTQASVPTAGLLLALVAKSGRPLARGEIHFLCAHRKIRRHNLINYVLPVERVPKPSFVPHLPI